MLKAHGPEGGCPSRAHPNCQPKHFTDQYPYSYVGIRHSGHEEADAREPLLAPEAKDSSLRKPFPRKGGDVVRGYLGTTSRYLSVQSYKLLYYYILLVAGKYVAHSHVIRSTGDENKGG